MATDTKGNLLEKVGTLGDIVFVRKFRPYSDDPEWGNLEFYSIYNGEVITKVELGVFALDSWGKFEDTTSNQHLLYLNTVSMLRQQTKERIETLAGLADLF